MVRSLDSDFGFGQTVAMAHANLRNSVVAVVGVCCCLLTSKDALADGMRCGSKLVSNGDASHLVRAKCGAPQNVEQRTETETVRRRIIVPCRTIVPGSVCVDEQEYTVTHQVETWTYDFGTSRLVHYATFVDGALRDVKTGGYGTRDVDE